ncbi:type II toxin-antitoxin system Phd/YefM family antitoxin [Desnuesiella massiliensis]|uniref:type II toxin-antitoxin system Phd/YefM family antitoxin n=1 Tax=Desnuesiella massiliensis TaxID=1650662 RepID=UPI0006E2B0B3|nr:type II toxin-antitoxin system Phd/YefM family antitoxin [Desnuesiella massiliensis]
MISDMLNAIVPISRFNKGEANKIFDEVNKNGYKIVVKNNKPTCVLITPERYREMEEIIENYNLLIEAERRMENAKDDDFIYSEEVLLNLGITKEELSNIDEVEID